MRDVDRAAGTVSRLLVAFGTPLQSDRIASMRAEAYLEALADLPWWAIEEACRRWLRGEAGDCNYSFAPSPPQLRMVAINCRDRRVNLRKALERLLAAEVEREYSLEHRGQMLAKLADLLGGLSKSLSRETKHRPPEAQEESGGR